MTTTPSLFTVEQADARTLELLIQIIENHNLPGFDYIEFKRAVMTLQSMNLDEATACKSAFATAATVGVTKEKLLESAAYYRNLLEKERQQFATALDAQLASKVTARQQEVARLRDQIERHKAEIVRLQDEMADYLNQAETAENQAKTESEKIEKARTGFEQTLTGVLLKIDADVEMMNRQI